MRTVEKLKVVTNAAFKPMEYREKDCRFDVDLIKAVAAEAGYDVSQTYRLGSNVYIGKRYGRLALPQLQ